MSRNTIILDGKFAVSVDEHNKVSVKHCKNKGSIESQSVEAILLLEIICLLKDNKETSE